MSSSRHAKMPERRLAYADTNLPQAPQGIKQRRCKKKPYKRPNVIPMALRKKLTGLGHSWKQFDTSDANLNTLCGVLTTDLKRFKEEAKRWSLLFSKLEANTEDSTRQESSSTEQDQFTTLPNDTDPNPSNDIISLKNYQHIIEKLHYGSQPSLYMAQLKDPRLVYFNASNICLGDQRGAIQHEVWSITSNTSKAFGWPNPSSLAGGVTTNKSWSRVDNAEAMGAWNLIFQPISAEMVSLNMDASSASRSNPFHSHPYHPKRVAHVDSDGELLDALDYYFASKPSHADLVNCLFYSSAFMDGFLQWRNGSSEQSAIIKHLGINVTRIVTELIFSREISDSPALVLPLLSSIIGLTKYFIKQGKGASCLSLFQISWQIASSNSQLVNSMTKILLSFVPATFETLERRQTWVKRSSDMFLSTPKHTYYLKAYAYMISAFYALSCKDLSTMHQQLNYMEELLVPSEYSDLDIATISATAEEATNTESIQAQTPENSNLSDFTPSISSDTNPYIDADTFANDDAFALEMKLMDANGIWNGNGDLLENDVFSPFEKAPIVEPLQIHESLYSRINSFNPPIPPSSCPALSNVADWTNPSSSPTADCTNSHHPTMISSSKQHQRILKRSTGEKIRIEDDDFVPTNSVKFAISAFCALMRAEASLLSNDQPSCLHWTDIAEGAFKKTPFWIYLRLQAVDISCLDLVFTVKCNFPQGPRTVMDELLRRLTPLVYSPISQFAEPPCYPVSGNADTIGGDLRKLFTEYFTSGKVPKF